MNSAHTGVLQKTLFLSVLIILLFWIKYTTKYWDKIINIWLKAALHLFQVVYKPRGLNQTLDRCMLFFYLLSILAMGKQCRFQDEEDCYLTFAYRTEPDGQLLISTQKSKGWSVNWIGHFRVCFEPQYNSEAKCKVFVLWKLVFSYAKYPHIFIWSALHLASKMAYLGSTIRWEKIPWTLFPVIYFV